MSDVILAIVYAVLTWWFTTGVILFLDGLPRTTFRWSMAGATLILCGALFQMRVSAADPTMSGAARSLSDADIANLAAYFSSQSCRAATTERKRP